MATTPEGKVKKKVKSILDLYGAFYFSPTTGGFGGSGIPDIIACYKGRFVAIECKAGKNTPTELQKKAIANIQKAQGSAIVVNEDSLGLVEDVLNFIDGNLK